MNIKKLVTILDYLAFKLNSIDKLKAVKLLYYIDKIHFIEYGRFVTNDTYLKLPYGPVPTRILDILNDNENNMFEDEKKYLDKYIEIDSHKNRNIKSKKMPDLSELSKSEIKIIDRVLAEYGKYSGKQLIDIAHKEYAWKKAGSHEPLSVKDMIKDLPSDKKKELLNHFQEDKETNKFIREFCLV